MNYRLPDGTSWPRVPDEDIRAKLNCYDADTVTLTRHEACREGAQVILLFLLACNRPTWHVTCTDATGETAFAADCVGNIYIERDGVGARATCFPYGGLGPSEFHVELAACSATKEPK